MWGLRGFDNSDDLLEEHTLVNVDDETLCAVLGLRDIQFYAGGSYPVSGAGRAALTKACGLSLRDDLDYYLEYFQDYPGQRIPYVVDEAGEAPS